MQSKLNLTVIKNKNVKYERKVRNHLNYKTCVKHDTV